MNRWITFERDFLWEPQAYTRHVAIRYRRGMTVFATRELFALSLGSGAARKATDDEIERARRRAA